MTIVLKEAARRRITRRRITESNGAAREYSRSLQSVGELTAFTRFQEDIHEYDAAELAAMEAGEFERPLR